MGYRVNGLPPFQVSFSITFPEGYVGKEKMDTKFKVEADDSQVQAGKENGHVSSELTDIDDPICPATVHALLMWRK